jgi:hypothetical protein
LKRALGLALLLALLAPAGRAAVIEGRVRHATRGEPSAGLEVVVLGFDVQENTVERSVRTDAEGRFRVADLPSPAIYLVRPRGEGFLYPGTPVAFRPGDADTAPALELSVHDTSRDPASLRVAQVQWVVERDAGVFRVSQRARVANSGPYVVVVPEGDPPLLRVALAPGHGEVATPFDRLPAGVRLADGVAEIRGPVFPGDEGLVLQLSYDVVAAPGGGLATEIRAPDAIDEVALYVQDFGVRIDAGALHPARVARQDDVFFQSFLGFDLEPRSFVPVRIEPLPPARDPGDWVAIAAVTLLAGALVWFVGSPIARERGALPPAAPSEEDPAQASGHRTDAPMAEALRAALADLEHDYETGKLSAEDRKRIERELTRAAEPPAQPSGHRTDGPRAAASSLASRACACGRRPAPTDRFCAACGRAL